VGIAIIVLWRQEVFPTNFVGEAQSPFTIIIAPTSGRLLLEDGVDLFQSVSSNQVLARVQVKSEDGIALSLAQLKTELEIMRVRLLHDQQRNDLNYLQTQQDLLMQRLELAGARLRLRQAQAEYERMKSLLEQGIVSEGIGVDGQGGYEVALLNRDLARAEIADRERLVAQLEDGLRKLEPGEGDVFQQQLHSAIDEAIEAQEKNLAAAEAPVVLRAPIDGMIMLKNRQNRDYVTEGEVLFEIRGERPEWILGFIRQPIAFRPRPGDMIRVMSRSRPRRIAEAEVLRVGTHLQRFAQPLRVRGFDASQERGLPVFIAYPEELELSAGELVDLLPVRR
jgi:multidrug resistance efflux pump